jgi:hypothetical protein
MESCVYINERWRGCKGHTAGPRLRCGRRWQVRPPLAAHAQEPVQEPAQEPAQVPARVLSSAFTAGPTAGPQRFGEGRSLPAKLLACSTSNASSQSHSAVWQCSAVSTVQRS